MSAANIQPGGRFRSAWETPWKVRNELERLLLWPLLRIRFGISGVSWKRGWRLYGAPIIQRNRHSVIQIGERMELRSSPRSNPLGVNHPCILCTWKSGATLTIGDDFGMTGGALIAMQQIEIGNRVWIGANALITDGDFHPLSPTVRRREPAAGASAPVCIEDDVFIGTRALVLKGVQVGSGSVIGAGSVVTRDVAPGTMVAGNPARLIRRLYFLNQY